MTEIARVPQSPPKRLKQLPREELALFVAENVKHLLEEEALAILDNPFVTPAVCQTVAQNQRLIGFYSVRLKLVSRRVESEAIKRTVVVVHIFHPRYGATEMLPCQ